MSLKHLLAVVVAALGVGCVMGPDFQTPAVNIPADWRWKMAEPKDHVPRGDWWTVFSDTNLNQLEERALSANQDLQAATARVEQARATARFRNGDFFPSLDGNASWMRYRTSGNRPSPVGFAVPSFTQEQWNVPFDLSYEVDLWGKVRRSFESVRNQAFAAEAARESVLLSLQADVAADYFALQSVARQIRLLEDAIQLRNEALAVFQQRLQAGLGSQFEVQRAKVEVASASADLGEAKQRQAALENALAVLCGQPPSSFHVQIAPESGALPVIAANVPSSLLERRPDVAEAERMMAARNAEIGVAKTALFPSLKLTGSGGLQSGELQDIFSWESRTWSIGPSLTIPIFAGGKGGANIRRAEAAYEEAVAVYRQRVLVAFRDVEDNLAALGFLSEQAKARTEAAEAAIAAAGLAFDRYRAGAVNFLEVVDAESARLRSETSRILVAREQMAATVRLIKALGGGWDAPTTTTIPITGN